MTATILVAHATRYGSTQEVAETIAAALRFPYNLIPALKTMPASDARDWTAIRTWANGQASRLQTPAA